MTLRRLLALAWCASAASLAAQTPFHGTVLSKRDGQPIVAAEVGTVDGRVHAWTDEGGRFVLLAGAGDSVRIHAVGHAEWRGQLAAGDTVFALEPYTAVLAAVTTTAGQRSIRTSESTASVTVIGRADLDAAAAIGVDQALRRVPGLQELASPPSKSTVSIRGLDAAHVLVLVDGEPVPGGLIDTRDIGRLSSVAAERIEVTKGPSSVEFGSDALGGVINLITARPSPSFSLDATARAGELGRKESTLDLSSTVGKFGYRLSGGWRQLDRLVAVDASGTSLDRVYDVRTDTRYRASDALMLRGDMQLSQERQRWPVGGGYNGFIDNHAAQGLFEARYLGWGGIVRARVFGQYYDYEYRQSQQLLPIEGSADSLQQTEHLLRGMVSYARAVGAHTLDFGAQLSARSIVAPQKISGNRASDDVTEVFARDAWSPGPFLVTAGGRVTNSTLWGGTFAPSVGVAWQVSPILRLRANEARGFRAPSFKEIRYTFTNPAAGYVIVGNPSLVPETSWSTEGGATFAPTSRFEVDATVFHNRVSDLIDTRFTGTNPAGYQVYQNLNVARALTEGAEVTATYDTEIWSASLSYNLLNARDLESGKPLDRRAKHSGRAQVSRTWAALRGLKSDLSAQYTGATPIGDQTQGAMLSVDAQLRFDVTPHIEASAGVTNLFNERPAFWTPAFQRQLFVGLRTRIGARN